MNTESSKHPYNDPFLTPGAQAVPTWSDRVRHSKALIPTLAVLFVGVLALAATLVAQRSDALAGGGVPSQEAAVVAPVTKPVTSPASTQPARVARAPVQTAPATRPWTAAPVCSTCGVVESVVAVQHTAPGSGLGAVAGGVAGALLGNQVGGGNGRTAMTVIGAVGGGYAGNAIEKNYKKTTSYQMRVRMEDGSHRTIEQASPISAGSRVIVEGNSARMA